ncbi:hypothetical protein G9A89_018720 [Geosiphon pyriformis]|nr:hypothetical protein G9A89_018720 [Geosiphon pyriformis]
MTTSATNHHLAPPPSSLGLTHTTRGIGEVSQTTHPSPQPRVQLPPSPRTHSKSILTIALQKAQSAVLLDSANNVGAALAAYKQTVKLLLQVIDKAANDADRRRLQHIHDTYADRIRLLSTIAPDIDPIEDNEEYENYGFSYERNPLPYKRHSYSSAESSGGPSIQTNPNFANSPILDQQQQEHSRGKLPSIENEQTPESPIGFIQATGSKSNKEFISNSTENLGNNNFKTNFHNSHTNEIGINLKHNLKNELTASEKIEPNNQTIKLGHQEGRTHKSNSSTSTTKSWNSSRKSFMSDKTTPPVSDYESAIEKRKSVVNSNESSTSSDDAGSSTDDANTIDELANSEFSAQLSPIKTNVKIADKSTTSTGPSQIYSILSQSNINSSNSSPNSYSLSQNPQNPLPLQLASTKERKRSSIGLELLISPSQKNLPTSSLLKSSTTHNGEDSASIKSSRTDGSIISASTVKQISRPLSSSSSSSSSSTTTTTSSSTSNPQKPVEKLADKALSQSRRPSPLTLNEQNNHNSRIIPIIHSTTNSSVLATLPTTNGLIGASPRRAASNPGQPRKNNGIRFLQNNSLHNAGATQQSTNLSEWNQPPGSPNSPWTNSFNFQSPPLNNPIYSLTTGVHLSDSTMVPKAFDPGYSSMVDSSPILFNEDITFDHPSEKGIPDPPPIDVHLRPFWLMRILERTMTTGGYLTKKLFVPNNMWVQANVKLASVEAKLSSCEIIYNCLLKLEKITMDDLDGLVKELDSIEPLFDGIQNNLARKLSYVESTNGKSRQSTSIMNWGSKLSQRLDRMGMGVVNRSEEANSYVDTLLKVFQIADIVEVYIRHFSLLKGPYHHHHTHIVSRLYKMSDFFGNVLCRFVVRDLGILADKYVKRGGNWVID